MSQERRDVDSKSSIDYLELPRSIGAPMVIEAFFSIEFLSFEIWYQNEIASIYLELQLI